MCGKCRESDLLMKIKTCELSGAALDWAVVQCVGSKHGDEVFNPRTKRVYKSEGLRQIGVNWNPSKNWSQAGPIIQGERICLDIGHDGVWLACIKQNYEDRSEYLHAGQTALEAAMRCLVSKKLGHEVEIPGELL